MIRNRIFSARHRRPEPRRRLVSRLGSVVVLCALLAGTAPALAASTPTEEPQASDASSQSTTSTGVEIGPDTDVRPPCDLIPLPDCDKTGGGGGPGGGSPVGGGGGGGNCAPSIETTSRRVADGGELDYSARLSCDTISPEITAVTYVLDRTPGRDGVFLSPQTIAQGTKDVSVPQKTIAMRDRDYPAGSEVEVVLQLVATLRTGGPWTECGPLDGGLRYVRPCEFSPGRTTVRAWIGKGPFRTQVQHPPEVCREDHTAIELQTFLQVVPHIRYCGYFDMGANSRITRVEKIRQTDIIPRSGSVCDANFFPNPPAADGTPVVDGQSGRFQVTVRATLGPCSDILQPAAFLHIDRTYRPNGLVVIGDHNT